MPTLTVNGRDVEVDDSFLSLSPEQQEATVDEIAQSLGLTQPQAQGHNNVPEFDPGVAGYNPQTGMVEPTALDRTMDKVGAFSSNALEGMPIVGPSFNNVTTDIAAGLVTPFSDKSFAENRQQMADAKKRVTRENPKTALAGSLTGAIGPMIPLGATALGGRMLGLTGPTLAGRTGMSALSSATIGGADTAARGGGLLDIGKSALVGGAIGGAIPLAGAGLKAGWGALKDAVGPRISAITNPSKEAARRVAGAMETDARNSAVPLFNSQDEAVAAANRQPVLNVDRGGETTRALARSAANNDPEARALIDRTVQDRFVTQGNRAVSFIDRMMGGNTDDIAMRESLNTAAKAANGPAYRKAYQEGMNGVMSPELERLAGSPAIADAMKGAITKGQNRAIAEGFGGFNPKVKITPDGRISFNGKGGVQAFPDLQLWDYTKRELDDMSKAAFRAGRDSEGGALAALSKQLRDELDNLVPSYKAARTGSAAFFGAEDAMDAGRKFVNLSRSVPETRQAILKMKPAEREAFQVGFASELKDMVKAAPDRQNVINRLYGSQEAREKIALALGPEKATQFEAFARVENIMDTLRGAMGNSTTARQLKELGMAAGAGTAAGYITGDWKTGLTTGLLVRGARAYGAHVDENMAKNIAGLLLSDDPRKMKLAIQMAAKNPKYLQAVTAIERFVGSGLRGAIPSQTGPRYGDSNRLEITVDRPANAN